MIRLLARPGRALAFLLLLLLAGPAAAERQWLGEGAIPSRYDIAITPDAEAGTFTGSATIRVETAAPRPSLTLNALDLTIERATIDGRPAAVSSNDAAQTITLTPSRAIAPGRHTVRIDYRGRINDAAYGLFRVSYHAGGQTRRMLATQFEPGDARRLAPMWDQPNLRAVFELTVTAHDGQTSVSNMPVAQTTRLPGGRTRVRFQPSPSMPSYLLFLALGDFERISTNVDGVDLGVIARRGEAEKGRYALEAGAESLRYYTDYFGIRYPLPKLDMIAVPGAGGFGAMENWGAILYFDQYILLDQNSSEAERRDTFDIVAHEIAHQWFGNLVTMHWWDDLWLNEGFASWMATKAAGALHPDWTPWLQVFGDRNDAMEMDARAGTHPIVQRVDTLEQANLAFDDITYDKGQAVIRMLESHVGEEAFREGVRRYLSSHLYGSAQTAELWSAIQAASGQPIMEIAQSFTGQQGFPVATVFGEPCRRGDRTRRISVTQRRFASDDVSRTNERWTIPLVAQTLGGAAVRTLAAPAADGMIDLPSGCSAPIIVNAGQTAFFRTHYSSATDFDAIAAHFGELSPADQLGILSDYWAFGRAGYAPITNYLELVRALPATTDPYVAVQAARALHHLSSLNRGRTSEAALRAFALRTLKPMFERVGWEARTGEGINEPILRDALIRALGRLGDPEVVAEARRRAAGAETDPALLPGAVREAALRVVAANADAAQHRKLLGQARATQNFVEQRRLFSVLAETRDPALARATLDLTLGDMVPITLRPSLVENVAAVHPTLAWDFVASHRSTVESWLDPLRRLDYAPGVASAAADPAVAQSLEAYAASFPENARQAVEGAAAGIRAKAHFVSTELPALDAWLSRR
jgi:aminopeptidase N